jgi:predicted nucleotidyltransferase
MRRDDIIEQLRANADAIRSHGVTALYLYGSAARDEAGPQSDVDLFADVDYSRFGFVPFMDLRDYLANLFGRKVDFTTRAALHPDISARIIRSAIKVFDHGTLSPVAAE